MLDVIKNDLAIALSVITLGTVIFGWFRFGGNKAIEALDLFKAEADAKLVKEAKDITDLERRMQKIEDMLPHLPDRTDFHKLELSMTRQESRLEALVDKFQVYSGTVTRLDEYMREHNK